MMRWTLVPLAIVGRDPRASIADSGTDRRLTLASVDRADSRSPETTAAALQFLRRQATCRHSVSKSGHRLSVLQPVDETPFDPTFGLPSVGELLMDGVEKIRSAVVDYKRRRAERRARKEVDDALAAFCAVHECSLPTPASNARIESVGNGNSLKPSR